MPPSTSIAGFRTIARFRIDTDQGSAPSISSRYSTAQSPATAPKKSQNAPYMTAKQNSIQTTLDTLSGNRPNGDVSAIPSGQYGPGPRRIGSVLPAAAS